MRNNRKKIMEPFILPEEKLNELAQKVSADLFESHYFEQDRIQGEALKSFAEHEQVNRFLIFQVFQVWEMQINKLYHPYFNLEKAEIKQTLQTLKNQISRCIEVSKDDFQPMLKRAVYNNLRLLLAPRETFESFFFAQQETLSLNVYERYAQFFHDLDFVVDIILKYYHKNQQEQIDKHSFFEKMDKVVAAYNRKSGQDFDQYRKAQFRALTGRSLDEVMQEAQAEIKAREVQKRAEEERQRQQAEQDARRKEEEARRRAQEEAMRRAEEEKKRMSFFDTLAEEKKSSFDLDLDELDEPAPTSIPTPLEKPALKEEPPVEPEPTPEPKAEVPPAPEPKAETPPASEPTPEPEPEAPKVEPTPPVSNNHHPIAPSVEPPAEPRPEPDPKAEPPKAEASPTQRESTSDFLDRFLSERQKRDQEQGDATPTEEPPRAEETKADEDSDNQADQEDKPASVLDRLNERSRTVADRFSKPQAKLADSINSSRKIKLDEIPIHKQYQYVQKVFEGNNVRFRIIVDKVNNAQNKDEVEDILTKFVLSNDSLDRKDHVVNEFIELLRNRF